MEVRERGIVLRQRNVLNVRVGSSLFIFPLLSSLSFLPQLYSLKKEWKMVPKIKRGGGGSRDSEPGIGDGGATPGEGFTRVLASNT